jgi:SulP family sulfate permease
VFGAAVIELIPRMIVGGVLVFLGLAFIVEWVWDMRRILPRLEYVIVLVILAGVIAKGFLPGVVLGLVLAVVLFRSTRADRVGHEGPRYARRTWKPAAGRRIWLATGPVIRVHGFVFFGSANGLLERIRKRVETTPPRFLLLELGRVTGVDASAVVSFVKVIHLAEANGFELVFAGASDPVLKRLTRGGVVASEGVVRFEPDLIADPAVRGRSAGRGPGRATAGAGPATLSAACRRTCRRTSNASRCRREPC